MAWLETVRDLDIHKVSLMVMRLYTIPGRNSLQPCALHDLHYFIPYIKGEGVRDIYEIVRVRTITGKEAKQIEGESATDDMRLAFELRFSRKRIR